MTSTHAISSDLIDRIIKSLELLTSEDALNRFVSPDCAKDIQRIINDLNLEREWFVVSVLHRSRPDGDVLKMISLSDDEIQEISNNISNNQEYDDALDLAWREELDKFFEDRKETEEKT